jgi:hypothetical protein
MSTHVRPSPANPALQMQVKDPSVLSQVACSLQFAILLEHSFMSTQTPSRGSKPVLQTIAVGVWFVSVSVVSLLTVLFLMQVDPSL